MFDIGISELGVIAVVALIVIGPERLPRVARTVGTLLGRAQRYVNDVKAEVSREIELEELKKLQTQMQDAARGIQEQVSSAGAEVHSAVHDMEKSFQTSVDSVTNEVSAAASTAPGIEPMVDEPTALLPPAEPSPLGPAGHRDPLPKPAIPSFASEPSALGPASSTPFPYSELTEPPAEALTELSPPLPGEMPAGPKSADSAQDNAQSGAPAQSSLFP